MSRVKGGLMAQKRRRNILEQVKGYRFGRSKKTKQAIEAIHHAKNYSFAHRKDKKNDFRQLWIVRINAALMAHGIKYSRFIKALKDKGIGLDRKILSSLAKDRPEVFERIVNQVK
ncbi:50S ribosomal protein L20 [Candidatus Kaiserbacteria bacterium RIFOXYB1_FULL_46_14]|uniref:Large ribosomal subunit protein bL20 n=1 Tax=Candidatus Kaiserbacteria bacterium RIFOXYB1_FULL_46_14 TaxID=1798531 RepID=A0A1F6FJ56_9BACT|nr:MAG: 50S ribosomal protein L20 [Candidatus Kaiserbacteria bacterium RIFOXYB1_FULL_46_14]